jgi:hypothetical protein
LELEVLSGPLDGHVVVLDAAGAWGRGGKGPLRFPWDGELGAPQARFAVDDEGWWLEGLEAPRGTYRVNREEKVRQKVLLKRGDLLKASETWLVVREA